MKTQSMQRRLEALMAAGKIESGKSYNLMPSDCRGNGYDIALTSRNDESGDYEVAGHLCRVKCTVRVGSRHWSKGIPAGYRLDCDPAIPYALCAGERAEVIHRTGTHIGSGSYMSRTLASIAIRKADGKLKYRGHTPYWLGSTATYASHYVSGRNKIDEAAYRREVAQLESIVRKINAPNKPVAQRSRGN